MKLQALFRTKSVDRITRESETVGEHTLKRTLTAFDLTMLGIGAVIGTGIFAAIGTATAGNADRPGAGPAIILSFALTAVACIFSALCYAEFATMIPISGSAYTYAYATLGEMIAWIIGWDLIIEYAVGNIAVAISWAAHFNDVLKHAFGYRLPDWLVMDYESAAKTPGVLESAPHLFGFPIVMNVAAVAIVALVTWVLVVGVKESAVFNNVMVGIKILILVLFVWVGFKYVNPAGFTPFIPNGWAGVQAGAALIFFAYIGFDAVSTAAEETRNPKRDIPIGIIGSLVICTFIYVAVAAVLIGIMPWTELGVADPLPKALAYIHLDRAAGVVSFGAVVAFTAVLLVFQLGQPRIFFSMSRDGLLPKIFARVHPKYRTPHVTTIWTGIFVAFFALFSPLDKIVELTNIGTLFAFVLVCAGVMILRHSDPHRPRPFKTPWIPLLPVWLVIIYALPSELLHDDWGGRDRDAVLGRRVVCLDHETQGPRDRQDRVRARRDRVVRLADGRSAGPHLVAVRGLAGDRPGDLRAVRLSPQPHGRAPGPDAAPSQRRDPWRRRHGGGRLVACPASLEPRSADRHPARAVVLCIARHAASNRVTR